LTQPLPLKWLQHLPQDTDDAKRFEQAVRSSTLVLGRLRDILEEDLEALDRQETSEDQYKLPAWDCLQAHRNGDRARLRKILNLLSFMDQ
jgi:hypothetical protein